MKGKCFTETLSQRAQLASDKLQKQARASYALKQNRHP
jgi:hypothetical protein